MFGTTVKERKAVVFVGPSGGGKTTIIKRLMGLNGVRKTQTAEYYPEYGDTPGEYVEYRLYYGALQVIAADFSCIALIAQADEHRHCYPPGFGALFGNKPMIGIVTKIDRQRGLCYARQTLIRAGAHPIFEVSMHTGESWDSLYAYMENLKQSLRAGNTRLNK